MESLLYLKLDYLTRTSIRKASLLTDVFAVFKLHIYKDDNFSNIQLKFPFTEKGNEHLCGK